MADENTSKALRELRLTPLKEIQRLRDLITKENRDFTAEENAAWEKANKEYDSFGKRIEIAERAEKLEGEQRAPAEETRKIGREEFDGHPEKQPNPNPEQRATTADHRMAISAWCRSQFGVEPSDAEILACKRSGLNPHAKELRGTFWDGERYKKLQAIKRSCRSGEDFESRAMSHVIEATGGALIGSTMANSIEIATLAYGGMMEVADVITTASGEALTFPKSNDTSNTGAQISENTAVTTTATISTAGLTLGAHKFTSNAVLVPSELLEDSMFDVAGFVTNALSERLNRILNTKATTGVGATTFYGIVPAATVGKTTASATAIAADEILDLIHSVDPSYRGLPGTGFMFHDNILLAIRKLKDGQSQYLWQPGLTNGSPDRLLNFPYTINQDMQSSVATATRTMIFGHLKAYKIRRVGQFRVYRLVERYRDQDQDGFVVFVRADGGLLNAGTNPVKCMLQT